MEHGRLDVRRAQEEAISLIVNGRTYVLDIGNRSGEVKPSHTLAHTLRETLGLMGTKVACNHGACGTCTVLMDGCAVPSCTLLTVECSSKEIVTIEGLGDWTAGKLDPLQESFVENSAFQCGFCTPGIIMSIKGLLNRKDGPTDEEVQEALGGNFCRCISHYHVLRAVRGRPAEEPKKATDSQYRYIGKPTPRKDAAEIVSGRLEFLDDMNHANALYGKVLRSPYPHAIIKSINAEAAKQLPGVKAVLTHLETPDWKAGLPPHVSILDRKVRFVGDAVALIAAETEEAAEEAMDLIVVEYERLPAVYDVEEAIKPGAPQLYDQFPLNTFPKGCPLYGPTTLQEIVIGDVEKGFEEADLIEEGTYSYEGIPNSLPIEPPGVIVEWDKFAKKLMIYAATQTPNLVQLMAQQAIGPEVDVRCIAAMGCGGSYGTKTNYWQLVLPAAALSKATGKPVKLCYSKEEHFAVFTLRLGSRLRGKVGFKKDSTITALSAEWLVDTGAYSDLTQAQVAVGCGEAQLLLRCKNWDLQPKVVCTNRNPSGVTRGFGGLELKSALTPILTLAAEKLDLDPVTFFKTNFVRPGDGYIWRDGLRWTYRGIDFAKAIDEGARVFGWKDKWKGWGKPTMVAGAKRRGVGLGVHGNADVGEDSSEAYLRLTCDGVAIIHICIAEHGTGQRSNLCKMAAEVLKMSLDKVTITPPDTLVNPFEFGPVGSRGTYALGSAVIEAAKDAKRNLLERASSVFHAPADDLETEDGMVYIKAKPEVRIPWIAVLGIDSTVVGHGRFEPDFSLCNFMAVFVEVEVDVETGLVDLVAVTNATDIGQIIDPLGLENQLHSGLGSAGLDSALTEESVLDTTTGRIVNCNMVDYKWRTFEQLPAMNNAILETPFPTHDFGAIGVGEISPAPGPGAILMAASNAISRRLSTYPLTPDVIFWALGNLKEGD